MTPVNDFNDSSKKDGPGFCGVCRADITDTSKNNTPTGPKKLHKFSKQDVALTDDLESFDGDAVDSRGLLGGCLGDSKVCFVL